MKDAIVKAAFDEVNELRRKMSFFGGNKYVYTDFEVNDEIAFFGICEFNRIPSKKHEELAETFLKILKKEWKEKFETYKDYGQLTFCYESTKLLQLYAIEVAKDIDVEKFGISISAICYFPKIGKFFVLNTGDCLIYQALPGYRLEQIASRKKKLKKSEMSIFNSLRDIDYCEKIEGGVLENTPNALFLVTKGSVEYFESNMQKGVGLSDREFRSFSEGKRSPMIIGKITKWERVKLSKKKKE